MKTLSSNIFIPPSVDGLGIPKPLSYLTIPKAQVEIGDWVEPGQALISYTVIAFEKDRPPFLSQFRGDPTQSETFTITAPCEGYCIWLEYVIGHQPFRNHTLGFANLISDNLELPVLISASENESPVTSQLEETADQICNHLRACIDNVRYPLGSRFKYERKRFREVVAEDNGFWESGFGSSASLSKDDSWEELVKSYKAFRDDSSPDHPINWKVTNFADYNEALGNDELRKEAYRLCESRSEMRSPLGRFL